MNREIQQNYKRFRKAGESADRSLSNARTVYQFNRLADHGFVRVDVKPDDSPDLSYLDQDCMNDTRQGIAATKRERESIERDGVWGTIGEFRLYSGAWEHADSVWGHTGYRDVSSPFENAYVIDIMASTIAAFKVALSERFCGQCGHRCNAA